MRVSIIISKKGQASEIFAYQDAFRPSSVIYEEPNYDPSADLNRPFGSALGQDYSSQHNHCAPQMDYTNYSWSTPSCVSDHEKSDMDDMDDPFACYPLSHPRGAAPQAYSPQINYDHYRRSSHAISQHKATDSYSSQQRIHISVSGIHMTRSGNQKLIVHNCCTFLGGAHDWSHGKFLWNGERSLC
jgi:hypothetical protein